MIDKIWKYTMVRDLDGGCDELTVPELWIYKRSTSKVNSRNKTATYHIFEEYADCDSTMKLTDQQVQKLKQDGRLFLNHAVYTIHRPCKVEDYEVGIVFEAAVQKEYSNICEKSRQTKARLIRTSAMVEKLGERGLRQ